MMMTQLLSGQVKHDYIWIFSSDIDQSLPNSEGSIIDFNGEEVSISYQQTSHMIGTENTSYSTNDGDLVAYSNGCDISDSNFSLMENGEDINPGEVHNTQCEIIDNYPSIQNSLMLPDPEGNGVYYYHKNIENHFYGVEIVSASYDVMYTYIDNDRVEKKNRILNTRQPHTVGYLEAIQHSNGEDWWILDFSQWDSLSVTQDDTLMYVYKIDKDSIYYSHQQ